MIFLKIYLNTVFTFSLLLLPLGALCTELDPFDKSLPEENELEELYRNPMLAIESILRRAEQYCSRLPSEKEFKDFILRGSHEYIRCSEKIKANIPMQGTGYKIGKDLPSLPKFLTRNQYQVYSDTKTIFVILKQKPSEWKYTHFKSEEYEFVIHCTLGMGTCSFKKMRSRINSCRANKTFAKDNCYFGDKKVIDY